jgi:phosphoribosylanthranilate isomerase
LSTEGRTIVKFCGMTSVDDVDAGVAAGADALGVILTESPRRISLDAARRLKEAIPANITLVAVVADPPPDLVQEVRELGAVPQFHGDELPSAQPPYIKTFHVDAGRPFDSTAFEELAAAHPGATLLVDSRAGATIGGTGIAFDWSPLREVARRRRIIVSGGLHAGNVAECIRTVRPYGVDVRSGIESDGMKDRAKMDAFVAAVREADASA